MAKYSAVAIIPFKETSERVPGKNFRLLAGRPLYEHIVRKALSSKRLEKVFVCTNSKSAREKVREMGAVLLDVPGWYYEGSTTGDKLLYVPAEQVDAEIYVQLFATAPFLRANTIDRAVEILQEKEYDSVLTMNPQHLWVWYKGSPITYYPGNLPRSQDVPPLDIETTGLYAMNGKALKDLKRRVGNNPFFLNVDEIEGWDIDEPLQFRLAELFMKDLETIQGITGKNYGMD